MKSVVIDSSALVALAIPNDADHTKAVAISKQLKRAGIMIMVPVEVVAETLNLLGKMQGRAYAIDVAQQLITASGIQPIDPPRDLIQQAIAKWQDQNADVSYTDALVMAATDYVATKAGEKPMIFGFDAVFSKNGYTVPQSG